MSGRNERSLSPVPNGSGARVFSVGERAGDLDFQVGGIRRALSNAVESGVSVPVVSSTRRGRVQGVFWLLTIPFEHFTPYPVPGCNWIRGQLESGAGGFLHWQIFVALASKSSLSGVKNLFGRQCHGELSRSEAAAEYVWKEDTRVSGTQFEFGSRPFRLNSKTDWEQVWVDARSGHIERIPARIRVVSYRSLRSIAAHYAVPASGVREAVVYWGVTGTGKSRTAWAEAGDGAYAKDPRSKYWCAYRGQENVIVDEFRGGIDIAHVLRWLDRYPVHVEVKGASAPLMAVKYWFTSNLDPREWWPDIDPLTLDAFLRRVTIRHFTENIF